MKPPRRRIAHANVERVDLKPDPRIPELSNLLGKGFILPAPILPRARFRSLALPTPMSPCPQNLPHAPPPYDPAGREIGGRPPGKPPRHPAPPAVPAATPELPRRHLRHQQLVSPHTP